MNIRSLSDEELVKQAQDGIVSGFEALVRRYHPRCMRLALGILNNREEAEEAVQDAFIRVHANIDSFRGDAKFSTWLYKILYNLCYTRLRKKKTFVDISVVEDRYEDRLLNSAGCAADMKILEDKDIIEKVAEALLELSERYKTVMHLYYIEDFTVEKIARIMKISRNSVKVRLYRGRALLRDIVVKRYGEEIIK